METYCHPLLGEVKIRRSLKARRLSITVRVSEVFVTVPNGMSVAEAIGFVNSKQEWIARTLKRNKDKVKPPPVIVPPYRTRAHSLALKPCNTAGISASVKGGIIEVSYPVSADPGGQAMQDVIRQAIEEAYRIEAKNYLPGRVETLARAFGFRYRAVSVRNSVTRWGSCSGENNISLSIHLMRIPDRLIDYIILHELCHTIHKNHGYGFHELLDKVTGGEHLKLRAELKNFTTLW